MVVSVLHRPSESLGAPKNARDLVAGEDEHSVGFLWPFRPRLQLSSNNKTSHLFPAIFVSTIVVKYVA